MAMYRLATEADLNDILDMMRRYYNEDQYAFVESEASGAVLDLIHDRSLDCLWVVEQDGRVVGYLAVTLGFSLEYRGRDAFIDELFIEPGNRGLGLGKQVSVHALFRELRRHWIGQRQSLIFKLLQCASSRCSIEQPRFRISESRQETDWKRL